MMNNNIFKNPYLQEPVSNNDISSLYKKLEELKQTKQIIGQNQQQQAEHEVSAQRKTVYTDISTIWNELSQDERKFIENSEEYVQANIEYQNSFNQFLLEKMGEEYLNSKYGSAPEKILGAIKKKKEEYQNNLSQDISTIKSQNQYLMQKNEELTKNNEEMSKLIKSLQDKLWVNN